MDQKIFIISIIMLLIGCGRSGERKVDQHEEQGQHEEQDQDDTSCNLSENVKYLQTRSRILKKFYSLDGSQGSDSQRRYIDIVSGFAAIKLKLDISCLE